MQRCTCTVHLGGDITSTVELAGVSPAEVLILRHIHGAHAVQDFKPGGDDRGRHDIDERARLTGKYRANVFREVFPGAAPQLPVTFKDIGVDMRAGYDEDDAPAAKRGRKKAEAADDAGVDQLSAADIVSE